MGKRHTKTALLGILVLIGLIALLGGCESTGESGSDDDTTEENETTDDGTTDDGTAGGTCDSTTDHTVEWKFSGSYTDSVSVATTWVKPSGEISDPTDLKYVSIEPANGTLLTETLPGCTGASINITMLDTATDSDDVVTLTDVTLSIYVDGSLVDSVSFSGSYDDGAILPSSGALTVVVGQ